MTKANFDTPEWQEYFKGKSPEEIEEIKRLLFEKMENERIENTQRKQTIKAVLIKLLDEIADEISKGRYPGNKIEELNRMKMK